ncbi:hypothetical protein GCM10027074_38310 [Streptomyces deserti]
MSRPPQYDNGAYRAHAANGAPGAYDVGGVHPAGGGHRVPPNVYHPRAAPPPPYEEYADPAAAHGWQNVYDETAELPAVPDIEGGGADGTGPGVGGGPGAYGTPPAEGTGGPGPDRHRHGSGRRGRRRAGPWRSRRVALVAGAVGAVSVAALIAGFSSSGSPDGGVRGEQDRTGQTAVDPSAPTSPDPATPATSDPASSSGPATADRPSGGAEPSRTASASPSAPGSRSPSEEEEGKTNEPPVTAPTTGTATSAPAPSPTRSAPGNADRRPGHGQGGTKGPK